jgi:hypothetical protein
MKKLSACVVFLCGVQIASAQFDYGFSFSKAGTAGLQSLKITVSARDAAMADAMTSLTNDATAVFVNPAGVAYVERPQAVLSHTTWLAGSRNDAAVVATPALGFVFAASVARFAIEEFEETTVRQPMGTGRMVSAGDFVIGLAAARRFTDKLTIGLQFKYVRESLDNDAVDNVLFDVGTTYFTGFHNLRLGFALQHFGPDMKLISEKFRTPLLFRVGAGEEIVLGDAHHLRTAVDLVHPTDGNEWVNWGLEYEVIRLLSLRAGYRFGVERGKLSFGVGVHPPELAEVLFGVDYAYSKFDESFGAIHQLTLKVGF